MQVCRIVHWSVLFVVTQGFKVKDSRSRTFIHESSMLDMISELTMRCLFMHRLYCLMLTTDLEKGQILGPYKLLEVLERSSTGVNLAITLKPHARLLAFRSFQAETDRKSIQIMCFTEPQRIVQVLCKYLNYILQIAAFTVVTLDIVIRSLSLCTWCTRDAVSYRSHMRNESTSRYLALLVP